jgi:hypothetical protein
MFSETWPSHQAVASVRASVDISEMVSPSRALIATVKSFVLVDVRTPRRPAMCLPGVENL